MATRKEELLDIAHRLRIAEAFWIPETFPGLAPGELPASEDAANDLGEQAVRDLARLDIETEPLDSMPSFTDLAERAEALAKMEA